MLDATQSPVMILCLGADVELTFHRQGPGVRHTARREKSKRRKTVTRTDKTDEIRAGSPVSDWEPSSRSTTKKRATGSGGQQVEEALVITLVHGDLLVVEGAQFRVSLLPIISLYSLICRHFLVLFEEDGNEHM